MEYQPSSYGMHVADRVEQRYQESDNFPHRFPVNNEALKRVVESAKETEPDATVSVKAKLTEAGLSPDALSSIGHFLSRETPMVTWFKPFKMIQGKPQIEHMTEDFTMRNLFELGEGNGSTNQAARRLWETRIFRGAYDEQGEDSARPKYGVLNIFNDPEGPQTPNQQYGDCFLVFAGLRDAASMTPKDSCDRNCHVSTLREGLATVLDEFQARGDELGKLAKLATGQAGSFPSAATYYKEIQIHAPIYFEQHVSHVVINPKYLDRPSDLRLLLNFAYKNGCWLITTTTTKQLASMRMWSAEKLLQFMEEHHINTPVTRMFASPQLMAGPQSTSQRSLFDMISDYLCMKEMSELATIVDDAQVSQWNPVGPTLAVGPTGAPAGRPSAAESSSSDDDDGDAEGGGEEGGDGEEARQAAAALKAAMEGGDCKTS